MSEAPPHVLPDVLKKGLTVVFVGTAAGKKSAERKAYYAGPNNRFWLTLSEIGLTPVQLKPCQYLQALEHGIGLTDLAKHVSGADSTLHRTAFDPQALRDKLVDIRPRVVAFTSKRAGQEFYGRKVDYGRQPETLEGVEVFVLSSPSGLARSHWNGGETWTDLAKFIGTLPKKVPTQ